jgi:hypothetical protein
MYTFALESRVVAPAGRYLLRFPDSVPVFYNAPFPTRGKAKPEYRRAFRMSFPVSIIGLVNPVEEYAFYNYLEDVDNESVVLEQLVNAKVSYQVEVGTLLDFDEITPEDVANNDISNVELKKKVGNALNYLLRDMLCKTVNNKRIAAAAKSMNGLSPWLDTVTDKEERVYNIIRFENPKVEGEKVSLLQPLLGGAVFQADVDENKGYNNVINHQPGKNRTVTVVPVE